MALLACAPAPEPAAAPEAQPPAPSLPRGPAPDFSLPDDNPTSARFGDAVSPRDHLERVSGWYFTQAS